MLGNSTLKETKPTVAGDMARNGVLTNTSVRVFGCVEEMQKFYPRYDTGDQEVRKLFLRQGRRKFSREMKDTYFAMEPPANYQALIHLVASDCASLNNQAAPQG